MADTRFSVRVPAKLAQRVDRLAKSRDRTRSYLTLKALEALCDDEEAAEANIREGLADLDAGRVVSHERVAAWLDDLAKGKVRRHPMPR